MQVTRVAWEEDEARELVKFRGQLQLTPRHPKTPLYTLLAAHLKEVSNGRWERGEKAVEMKLRCMKAEYEVH
jgi:hypothetical protein